jgi:hypothetical protein
MLADRRYQYGDPKSPSGFLADIVFWVDRFPGHWKGPDQPIVIGLKLPLLVLDAMSGISAWVFDTDLISRARHAEGARLR